MAGVTEFLSDEELESKRVPELKTYLRQHGQFVTGKKSELLERAKGVGKLHYSDRMKLVGTPYHRRLEEKLVTPSGDIIPDPRTLNGWTKDSHNIPDFSDTEMYNYFVLTKNVHPQRKAKVYFEDRHVHSVEFHEITSECSHALVRCKVIPSLPTTNKKDCPDHSVWLCLSKVTGKIHSADCSCAAGVGEVCNHVAALCHSLVDLTSRRRDGTTACTSQRCLWNNPRKRKLSPKKAQDVNFRKPGSSKAVRDVEHDDTEVNLNNHNFHVQSPKIRPIFDVMRFKEKLVSSHSKASFLKYFEDTPTSSSDNDILTVPSLNDISFSYCDHVDLDSGECKNQIQEMFDCMRVSEMEVVCIEERTRGQQGNDLWLKARSERLTASKFGDVVLMRSDTKPDNLLKDICCYRDISNISYCRWGTSHEPAARKMYKSANTDTLVVDECGLIVNAKYPHLGASPDGLVWNTCVDSGGVLEIKCPARSDWKWMHPRECAKDSTFFSFLDEHECVKLKRSHRYYFQVQGQMALTERQWCDFVVWTLNGWTVERIQFDEHVWNEMLPKLNKFYLSNVLPELFSRRVKRGIPLYK